MPEFYDISIKEIQPETADAVSVFFDIPQNLKDTFSFTAGEYLTLEKEINGEQVRRAYSICSSPDSGLLCVAIKKVPNGLFSLDAVDNFKVGDSIKVAAPEGRFLLTPESNKNYLAVAAGSGITPILSMIKSVLASEASSTFTLIYGNKSVADTMFYDELVSLSEEHNNFNLEFVFSRERNADAKFGRIDKGLTNLFVKNKYNAISFDSAYVCGPEAMIETVSETLKDNGFSEDSIHFELFSVSKIFILPQTGLIFSITEKTSLTSFQFWGEKTPSHAVSDDRHRYISYGNGFEELYDLEKDPHEFKNLASDENYTEIKNKLKKNINYRRYK